MIRVTFYDEANEGERVFDGYGVHIHYGELAIENDRGEREYIARTEEVDPEINAVMWRVFSDNTLWSYMDVKSIRDKIVITIEGGEVNVLY